ncbi:MAG: SdrD B-like domain-containing protein, partial [Pedobacter sp.]
MPADSAITNGTYGAYCVDLTGNILDNPIFGNVTYTVNFWSSLDSNLPTAVKQVTDKQNITYPIPWDKINYLLNAYPTASWLNLQAAYWDLVHGCTQAPNSLYTCGTLRPAPDYFPYGPNIGGPYGCSDTTPPLVDEIEVQNMVIDANANGNGFIPKAGNKIASVGQITNCTPTDTCNQYLPYQVIFVPTTCPTCTGTVGDFVWKDLNGNGIQDVGEPGIPNVEVKLTGVDSYGQTINLTTTTDSDGKYQFNQLCAGNGKYTVSVNSATLPTGVTAKTNGSSNGDDNIPTDSNEPNGTTVTITTDTSSNLTVDFGYVPKCTGSVGNLVWKDIPNENGVYDSGEAPLSGVTLSLTGTSSYGVLVDMTTATGSTGAYSFDGLCQGSYTVKVVSGVPAGFTPTTSTSSTGNDYIDNDSNNPAGTLVNLLNDSDANPTVDFGYVPDCKGSIGNYVWEDLNKNGIQDANEPGMDGVVVNLGGTNAYGELVSMTETTKDGGKYIFNGVCEGDNYTVTVNPSTVPTGWIPTTPRSANGSDGKETDSNEPNGTKVTMTDDSTVNASVDFGYIPDCKGTLGNYVWMDKNGNGLQDDVNGSGIDGVQILLTGTNIYGQSVTNLSSTTTGGGYYQFTGLCQGDYTVTVNTATLPAGAVATSPSGSSNGNDGIGNDSNQPIGTAVSFPDNSTNNDTVDFGYLIPASLGDRIWLDLNNNGVQDSGETGLTGWTVTLTKPDSTTLTTTTAGDGIYGFNNLVPGSYKVCATPMTGYTQTYDLDGIASANCTTLTINSGDNRTDVDFGYYKNATIGDFVWNDLNGNGVQESGETGLSGVTVNLLDCSNKIIATTTTDSTGKYSFSVPAGNYNVQFIAPNGSVFTGQYKGGNTAIDSNADSTTGATSCFAVLPGQDENTIDAGLIKLASLGDRIWLDLNNNGVQDSGETGLTGWMVTLTKPDNSTLTTTTAGDGIYGFSNLVPGSYKVCATPMTGYTQTYDLDGIATANCATVTINSGDNRTDVDFGYYKNASIGNFVWEDKNANGVQDTGETGISGVTVNLLKCDGTSAGTATTDANGSYKFNNLTPGCYKVQFTTPGGYTASPANQGTDDAKDSDSVSGVSGQYNLVSGQYDDSVDAGFYKPACTQCVNGVSYMKLKLYWRVSTGDPNERIRVRADSITGQVLYDSQNDGVSGTGLAVGTDFGFAVPLSAKKVVVTVQGINHTCETLKATFSAECDLATGQIN